MRWLCALNVTLNVFENFYNVGNFQFSLLALFHFIQKTCKSSKQSSIEAADGPNESSHYKETNKNEVEYYKVSMKTDMRIVQISSILNSLICDVFCGFRRSWKIRISSHTCQNFVESPTKMVNVSETVLNYLSIHFTQKCSSYALQKESATKLLANCHFATLLSSVIGDGGSCR